ncbi:MAG TPA: hypothetical protein P5060_02345 [Candidatus Absconditabacterales bacterium]|nr:hypothetical protein [Candidatus Absconditabacterales bacterium]
MNKYNSAFKAYDIRGIFGQNIDKTLFYNLGRGVGKYILEHFGKDGKFIFGGDGRLANNDLISYFLFGMMEGGYSNFVSAGFDPNIQEDSKGYLFGVSSTSTNYYLNYKEFDLGANFTASHNTAEYAGVKIFDKNSSLLSTDLLKSLIDEYREIDLTDQQIQSVVDLTRENTSKINLSQKIQDRKSTFNSTFGTLNSELKVVVDFSNGAGCAYEKYFLKNIQENSNIEFIFINEDIDSTFSNHESDTSQIYNYDQLTDAVLKNNADFGVMFDGDVDRIGMVDEKGEFISGDIIIALIINGLFKDGKEKRGVTVDLMCTKALFDIAKKAGVSHTESRVGYKFVKQVAIENNSCLGGEISGHILFAQNGYFENPILALYYICKELDGSNKKISDLAGDLHPYYKAPQTKYEVEDGDGVIDKIEETYSNYDISKLDGIKVSGDNFWFVVRKSNTEPIIRFCIEADNQQIRKNEFEKIKNILI